MLSRTSVVERLLAELVRNGKTPGLQYIVVTPSTTLFEYHAGFADLSAGKPLLADSTLMAYSMSKTVTAAAVLQLVDGERVHLDDPVARYVEWQPYGPEPTIRQLLSHTSGIPNPIPLRWVHLAAAHQHFSDRNALRAVLRQHPRLAFAPGTRFAYSNIGYWLLGAVIEEATGQAFASYVTDRVLRPLGIAAYELAYTVPDAARHAAGYLEKYSWMNLVKPWLIDRALIGGYEGRWLRIRDHYPNGAAFGGLVGMAAGFGKFLQDQLQSHSRLFSDTAKALLVEQQRTPAGSIPMTLGWHMATSGSAWYFFKEGGGGGFHSMMRLYPAMKIGTVLMTNATGMNVRRVLDACDSSLLAPTSTTAV